VDSYPNERLAEVAQADARPVHLDLTANKKLTA
jgi:hypothetical protein